MSFSKVLLYPLLLLAPGLMLAQEPEQPRFDVESEVRLLDLVVTDRNGAVIRDLKRSEIDVLFKGKPQEVVFFERFDSRVAARPKSTHRPAETIARPVPFIFILDLNSLDQEMLVHVKESIHDFIVNTAIMPSDRFMLVTVGNGLQARTPMTGSIKELVRGLDSVQAIREPISYARFFKQIELIYRTRCMGTCNPQLNEALVVAKTFLSDLRTRVESTSQDLASLGDYTAVIPQRKNFIYYSAGYPLNSGPVILDVIVTFNEVYPGLMMLQGSSARAILSGKLFGAISSSPLEGISASLLQLNRGQASVYSVDARSLVSKTLVVGTQLSGDPRVISRLNSLLARLNSTSITEPQSFLTKVSRQTGGRALLNRNDLETGVAMAVEDARTHYMVGFVPSAKSGDDEKGEIQVRVRRPDARPLVRSNWFSRKAEIADDELATAFRFSEFYRDFELDTRVALSPGALKVSMDIPTGELAFRAEGGKQNCTIEIRGALLDSSGLWVDSKLLFHKLFPIKMDDEQLQELRDRPAVTAVAEVEVPAGEYELVIVARQDPAGLISSISSPIKVP